MKDHSYFDIFHTYIFDIFYFDEFFSEISIIKNIQTTNVVTPDVRVVAGPLFSCRIKYGFYFMCIFIM